MEQVGQIFHSDGELPSKTFFLHHAESFDGLVFGVSPKSVNFGLFIASDSSKVSTETINSVADKLLSRGLAYLCVWGKDCERVHDIFDEAKSVRKRNETDDNVVITTWHSDESLSEAIWFFVNSAIPASAYERTCSEWIAVAIHNPEWENSIREAIANANAG